MVWVRNGTVTGSTQQLTGLRTYKFNQIINHVIDNGSAIDVDFRIDGISTSTYTYRESDDGSADVTNTSQSEITFDDTSAATERFTIIYGFNSALEEKLFIGFTLDLNTAGATTAPSRVETVGKQSGTSTAWTQLDILETGAGEFTSNSNLITLGTD